jgi:hypothetical protein
MLDSQVYRHTQNALIHLAFGCQQRLRQHTTVLRLQVHSLCCLFLRSIRKFRGNTRLAGPVFVPAITTIRRVVLTRYLPEPTHTKCLHCHLRPWFKSRFYFSLLAGQRSNQTRRHGAMCGIRELSPPVRPGHHKKWNKKLFSCNYDNIKQTHNCG